MSNRTVTNSPSAEEPSLRSDPDPTMRVYRLPHLGALRPAGSLQGVPPWEATNPEGPAPVRPVRDYYFA